MKTDSFALAFVVAGVCLVFGGGEAVRPPSNLYVNKCCSTDESLDANHQCVIGGSDQWWPIIYLIKKQSYFEPHGTAPRFFKVKERAHPYCAKPEFIYGPHSVALFSNGSLFLQGQSKFVEADNFCVDKGVAIVCDPDAHRPDTQLVQRKAIKIRKCCGRNAVYRTKENMCGHVNRDDTAAEQLVTTSNATSIEFVFGFPDCKISKYFTIAEEFNESNLDVETGRLILETGRKLESKSYCLEYVHDGNATVPSSSISPAVNVFTCADHLSAPLNDATDIPDTVNCKFYLSLQLSSRPMFAVYIIYANVVFLCLSLPSSLLTLTYTFSATFFCYCHHILKFNISDWVVVV